MPTLWRCIERVRQPADKDIATKAMTRDGRLLRFIGTRRGLTILFVVAAAAVVGVWYIVTKSGGGSPHADATDRDLVRLGKTIYAEHCADCHGAELEGEPDWRRRHPDGTLPAPPHDASGHTWHHPDSVLFKITKEGGQAVAPRGFGSRMPAYSGILSDREILASLAYIKSRWPESIRQRQERLNRQAR